jgi:predicted lipid-binding transport protein (Tim44 family)
MKKLLTFLLVTLMSLGLAIGDAEARRFGGGKSFGRQHENITRQATPPRQAQPPAAIPAPAGGSRWGGILGGMLAGGLLASLFMGHGFEGVRFLDIALLLALLGGGFLLLRALRRAPAPAMTPQYAGYGGAPTPAPSTFTGAASAPAPTGDFDAEAFVREAKGHFIRLQAAYDAGDLDDIRAYTTPEVFAEISLQLQERGGAPNKTEVVTLQAELADVISEGELLIASVRFSGLLRENSDAATPFGEVWHVQKPRSQPGATWRIAGIQQD